MISAYRPVQRPLSEIAEDEGDLKILAAAEARLLELEERRADAAHRLEQTVDWIVRIEATLTPAGDDAARLQEDLALAQKERREHSDEVAQLEDDQKAEQELIEGCKARIEEAHARAAKGNVWMVSSVIQPRQLRLGLLDAEDHKEETPKYFDDDENEGVYDDQEDDNTENPENASEEHTKRAFPLCSPEGLCHDSAGALFVIDTLHSCICHVSLSGEVRKFAGGLETGYRDGRTDEASFEGAEGVQPALFRHPRGISIDNGGNLFVADAENHCIRGISAQGEVFTLAGAAQEQGFADGPALEAKFTLPWALCVGPASNGPDASDALWVCDSGNHCVRSVATDPTGAGALVATRLGRPKQPGANVGELNFPWSIVYDPRSRHFLVGDKFNRRVVAFSPDATGAVQGFVVVSDVWPRAARFGARGLAVDSRSGDIFLTSSTACQVWCVERNATDEIHASEVGTNDAVKKGGDRAMEDAGALPLPAPRRLFGVGMCGHRDGRAEFSELAYPAGVSVGSDGEVVVADHGNSAVRVCRLMRADEVRAKLRKMMQDINNRGARMCFQRWHSAAEEAAAMRESQNRPMEPIDIVLALAMGTISRLGASGQLVQHGASEDVQEAAHVKIADQGSDQADHTSSKETGSESHGTQLAGPDQESSDLSHVDTAALTTLEGETRLGPGDGNRVAKKKGPSPLWTLFSQDTAGLQVLVTGVARALQWRTMRQRPQYNGEEESAPLTEEEILERVAEAKAVFEQFDADGGGTIDATELRAALEASDMEVNEREVAELIREFDPQNTGELSFDAFCKMQGIPKLPSRSGEDVEAEEEASANNALHAPSSDAAARASLGKGVGRGKASVGSARTAGAVQGLGARAKPGAGVHGKEGSAPREKLAGSAAPASSKPPAAGRPVGKARE